MRCRLLFAVSLSALLLSGCPKPRDGSKVEPTTPPPATSAKKCLLPDTSATNRCRNRVCTLAVIDAGNNAVVYPYKLKIGQHGPNRAVTIVWELVNPDMEFTNQLGPYRGNTQLKDIPGFKYGWSSNDPKGATQDEPGKYYRVVFTNENSTGTAGIDYEIKFRSNKESKQFSCDPNITNEAG